MKRTPKVVIVGGGFAGALCARHLENDFDVTLIDTKDYFEYTPSVLRVIVEPDHIRDIQAYHCEYLKHAHVVRDSVTIVAKDHVTTKKGATFPFDYLVISAGSSYTLPIKHQELVRATRAKELAGYHSKLKRAKRILIIGGGLVGVELAAEICTHFTDKHIMIAHNKDELLTRSPPRARKYAQRFLEDRGVKFHWNTHILGGSGTTYKSKAGKNIMADLAFLCTGITPNYGLMKKNYSTCLDENGFIKVNKHLQVAGQKNIFAAGDVNNIAEEKTAQNAEKQAAIASANIRLLNAKRRLVAYESKPRLMDISLGKHDGILIYKQRVVTGTVSAFIKWLVERKTMIHYA